MCLPPPKAQLLGGLGLRGLVLGNRMLCRFFSRLHYSGPLQFEERCTHSRTQACNLCQMLGVATQRHAPHPAPLSPPAAAAVSVMSGECCAPHSLHGGVPALYTSADSSLVACLPIFQPEAPSAQVMDFLFEKWKLYSDECHHNLSLLPPPTGESPHRLLCPVTLPGCAVGDLVGVY